MSGIIYDCGIVLAPGLGALQLVRGAVPGTEAADEDVAQLKSNQRANTASAQRRKLPAAWSPPAHHLLCIYYLIVVVVVTVVVIFLETSLIQTKDFATF